ncbi:PepSY domain-containing protein [Sphingobium scionense]
MGASRVHRWLALVIGVQLLLWFASGLVMSLLPIERVRGEHLVERSSPAILEQSRSRAPLDLVLRAATRPVREVRYRALLYRDCGGRVYRWDDLTPRCRNRSSTWSRERCDGSRGGDTGLPWYVGAAERAPGCGVDPRIQGRPAGLAGGLPDREATRVYVAQNSGRIVAVRNGTWRLYDFFWALHIMDWKNHENFNTPWLMAFAAGGLALAIAGSALLYLRWPRKRRRTG